MAVYGGLVLLMRVWYGLLKALARRPGVPIPYLAWMLALWVLPMLVVAPIFSRDVFSYAAQGEMMSRHINPYNYGTSMLGAGPYPNPVDPSGRTRRLPTGRSSSWSTGSWPAPASTTSWSRWCCSGSWRWPGWP